MTQGNIKIGRANIERAGDRGWLIYGINANGHPVNHIASTYEAAVEWAKSNLS